jgi:hypothetical protein
LLGGIFIVVNDIQYKKRIAVERKEEDTFSLLTDILNMLLRKKTFF